MGGIFIDEELAGVWTPQRKAKLPTHVGWRWHRACILLIPALCAFIILLFLPSLLELKRPKDPGPRKITETITEEDD